MKKDIHPVWYPEAKVTCICGNTFTVGSTKQEINIEICSACHPFFTGELKLIDTAGRVEKFEAKRQKAAPVVVKRSEKRQLRKLAEEKAAANRPQNLKEMFQSRKNRE